MKIFAHYILFTLALSILGLHAHAQNYKWFKGGGSIDDMGSGGRYETALNMCTDANGNVYAMSIVGDYYILADTFLKAVANHRGYTSNPLVHILFTSYDCNGKMRFAKLMEADTVNCPSGLRYDGARSVYISGLMRGKNKYFGYDTLINTTYNAAFLAKYDTSGKLRWVQFLGPDSASSSFATRFWGPPLLPSGIDIDGQGYIHHYATLDVGMHITPTLTTTFGIYDIKYDTLGTLISATKLDTTGIYGFNNKVSINRKSNTVFLNGFNYLAAYNCYGTKLWSIPLQGGGAFRDLQYDETQSLYGVGITDSAIFLGDTLIDKSTVPGFGDLTFIYKLDTFGHLKWVFHLNGKGSNSLLDLTILQNGQIAATGLMTFGSWNGLDTLWGPVHEGQGVIVLIVDTSGKLVKLDRLHANGFYNEGDVITSDSKNNIYIGGEETDSIYAYGVPAYHTNGGNTDYFVTKYGYNCNCTVSAEPTPLFTYSGNGVTKFTYTGTSTPDSVLWNFGDGTYSKSLNPSHSFSDTSLQYVCLTTYNCDSGVYCTYLRITLDIPSILGMPNVSVYPNPVRDELFIEGADKWTGFSIINVLGQQLMCGTITGSKQTIITTDLQPGIYILHLSNSFGATANIRIVKQ